MTISQMEAEILRRNAIAKFVANRRPQTHELRRGDSLLTGLVPGHPEPLPEQPCDHWEREMRIWRLSERYRLRSSRSS